MGINNLQESSTIMYESTFVCPFSTFWARLPGRVVAYLPYFPSYSLHCSTLGLYFPSLLFTVFNLGPLFSILLFISPIFHLTLYTAPPGASIFILLSIFHITLSLPYFPSHSLNSSISVLYFPSYTHNMCHPALQSYSTLLSPNFPSYSLRYSILLSILSNLIH